MAKKIIEARVIQKVGTEAEWLQNDLVLYKGEIALVSSGGNVINIKVGDGIHTFSELEYMYRGGFQGSINPTTTTSELPNGFYFAETSGTYTNADNVVVTEGYYTILEKNDSGWKVASSVEMPEASAEGRVAEGNTQAVSGGEVYEKFSDLIGDAQVNSTIMNYAVSTDPLRIGQNGYSRIFKAGANKTYNITRPSIQGNRFRILKVDISTSEEPKNGDTLIDIYNDATNTTLEYNYTPTQDEWIYVYLDTGATTTSVELNVTTDQIVGKGEIEKNNKLPISGDTSYEYYKYLENLKKEFITSNAVGFAVLNSSPLKIQYGGYSRIFKAEANKTYNITRPSIQGNRFRILRVDIPISEEPKNGDTLIDIYNDTTNTTLEYNYTPTQDEWIFVYLDTGAATESVELNVTTDILGDKNNASKVNSVEFIAELNRGVLNNEGKYTFTYNRALMDEQFYNNYRTDKYINATNELTIINFDDYSNFDIKVFEFDFECNFIKSTVINSDKIFLSDFTKKVKLQISKKDGSVIDNTPVLKVKTFIVDSIYSYNSADSYTSTVKTVINAGSFNGRDFDNQEEADNPVQYSETDYYTHTIVRFPKSYKPNGCPTKVIWFAHGSGRANVTDFDDNYINYVQYLVDQGYMVIDVFAWNNKYPQAVQYMNTPTNVASSNAMLKFYFDNYNIDRTGIYIFGKSHGGYQCYSAEYVLRYPIKAVAVLAGGLNLFSFNYGYHNYDRIASMTDLGVAEDPTPILTESGANYNAGARNYFKRNIDKFIGQVPLFLGAINLPPLSMIPDSLTELATLDFTAIQRVPVKTWIAKDDPQIDKNSLLCRQNAVKNSCSPFEIRYMASGNPDPHHIVDYSGPVITEIATKAGVIHYNVPVAYAEMLQYFERF